MRASELRPGEFFEFHPSSGRCLYLGKDKPNPDRNQCYYNFAYHDRDGDMTYSFFAEDRDVTPLNVHGWDDEPQTKAFGCCDTPSCTNHVIHGTYDRDGLVFCDDCQSEQPAPLQLREGARFLMRQQGETGPLRKVEQEDYVWSDGTHSWTAEGRYWASGWDSPYDLIAEVPPPVEPEQEIKIPHHLKMLGNENPTATVVNLETGERKTVPFAEAFPEPQPDADGWIEWTGGQCPVEQGTIVDVLWEHGSVVRLGPNPQKCDDAWRRPWIKKYRVVEAQPAPTVNECSLRYWWVQWVTPPTLDDLMATINKRGEP